MLQARGHAPLSTPTSGSALRPAGPGRGSRLAAALPGIAVCLAVAVAAQLLTTPLPLLSPLLLAIVAGVVTANLLPPLPVLTPGIGMAAKLLLRLGIVLLGLQLALGDVLALGAGMILVVVAVVGIGVGGTLLLGRLLRVDPRLTLLVACGFSICGAAAVAAAADVTDPDGEHETPTATAVALVVVCGTAMILILPAAVALLGLGTATGGLWAGAAIHEVAQVVAAGGLIGGGALALAVVVKLARVLMLAPVMTALALRERARARRTPDPEAGATAPRLPPIVPWFVAGFLALVLVRTGLPVPAAVLDAAHLLQTTLLGAAMFALGCGVRVRELLGVGVRPLLLALCSTVLVALVALGGVLLAS